MKLFNFPKHKVINLRKNNEMKKISLFKSIYLFLNLIEIKISIHHVIEFFGYVCLFFLITAFTYFSLIYAIDVDTRNQEILLERHQIFLNVNHNSKNQG